MERGRGTVPGKRAGPSTPPSQTQNEEAGVKRFSSEIDEPEVGELLGIMEVATARDKQHAREMATLFRVMSSSWPEGRWYLGSLHRAASRITDLNSAAEEVAVLAETQGNREARRALYRVAVLLKAADALAKQRKEKR